MAWITLLATPLPAQMNLLDLRLLDLNDDGETSYHAVFYSRFFGNSRISLEAFWFLLPRDDYDEKGIGIGYQFLTIGETSLTLLGYLSAATSDVYFQPALFALDAEGKLTWSFYLLRYLSLSDGGIDQWIIDPLDFQINVGGPVAIGASAYFYRPHGGVWQVKLGPKISITDKYGATEMTLRAVNRDGGTEVQLRRIFTF